MAVIPEGPLLSRPETVALQVSLP